MARLEHRGPAENEGEAPEEIAGIYVVGGASELLIVARALRERFGRRVHRSPYPSAAIAIGLAIACDDEAGFELADRYSRTFGVFREAAAGEATGCWIRSSRARPRSPSGAPTRRRSASAATTAPPTTSVTSASSSAAEWGRTDGRAVT